MILKDLISNNISNKKSHHFIEVISGVVVSECLHDHQSQAAFLVSGWMGDSIFFLVP